MHNMTEENLKAAFAGESQAHMRYLNLANRAETDGRPNVARLFRAVAAAEQMHASAHLRALGGVGGSDQNLANSIAGESFEVAEMYPAYLAVAAIQEEPAAQRSMSRAMEAEKVHAQLFQRAKTSLEGGSDVTLATVYVCSVCGWTGEGEPPDRCPLCNAPRERFITF